MQENIIMRGWMRVWVAIRMTGDFIINHSGKLFLLIVAVALLTFIGYEVRHSPEKVGLEVKDTKNAIVLGNDHLVNASAANKQEDYKTAYDEATKYLTSGSTTALGKVEAYLARGEAQLHMLKCKEAMADLYMAADVAPNDVKLQSTIAERLNVIFYGKDCDGKY